MDVVVETMESIIGVARIDRRKAVGCALLINGPE